MWFGAVSAVYPGHLGSLGFGMGVAAVVWGATFAMVAEILRGRRRHDAPEMDPDASSNATRPREGTAT